MLAFALQHLCVSRKDPMILEVDLEKQLTGKMAIKRHGKKARGPMSMYELENWIPAQRNKS